MDLIQAVKANDETRVLELLSAGADVNQKDRRNVTPLHLVTGSGGSALMRVLLEAGADANAVGPAGLTPLFWATMRGQLECVDLLLKHGADARHKDFRGVGVLDTVEDHALAIRFELLSRLIAAGANPNNCNIHGHPDLIAPLVSSVSRIKAHPEPDELNCQKIFDLLSQHNFDFRRSDDEFNMLWRAIYENSLDAVQVLIKQKVFDVRMKMHHGMTALHWAANKREICEFLIVSGADIEARDDYGGTPFFRIDPYFGTKNFSFWKIVGANINAQNKEGRTLLMIWCDVSNEALHNGRRAYQEDHDHYEQRMKREHDRHIEEMAINVKKLLELGVDTSLRDNQGLTALDIAIQHGHQPFITLLQ